MGEEREDRLPDLAADLVRLRVDAIVAWGGASIRAAQHATDTIPIVMAASGDPVRLGFVANLAHPGERHGLERLDSGAQMSISSSRVPNRLISLSSNR